MLCRLVHNIIKLRYFSCQGECSFRSFKVMPDKVAIKKHQELAKLESSIRCVMQISLEPRMSVVVSMRTLVACNHAFSMSSSIRCTVRLVSEDSDKRTRPNIRYAPKQSYDGMEPVSPASMLDHDCSDTVVTVPQMVYCLVDVKPMNLFHIQPSTPFDLGLLTNSSF